MDSMLVQYGLFLLVVLCIISAVVSLNRWLYRHNKPADPGAPNTWAKLDTRRHDSRDETLAGSLLDEEEEEEDAELHVRARQNGHHSNGHHPQS